MIDLKNQNVVVIGGTSGIGLAAAAMAQAQGANVWAAGRSAARVDAAQAEHPAITFSCVDVHDADGLKALFESIGTIDHVVAAATGAERAIKPFLEQTAEEFSGAFGKLWGYCNLVRQAVPCMSESASITLVSGSPARKCNPGMSAVSCTGNAVEGLTRALAVEIAPRRINVVAPGLISTGMFDWLGENKNAGLGQMTANNLVPRAGEPDEVASAIVLCMTNGFMTGTTVDVDGGALLP